MKVEHLSASKIKTYEQCPLKYHAIYDLGVPEGAPHPLATMGKAVHLALERGVQVTGSGQEFDLLELTDQACGELNVDSNFRGLAKELVKNAISWGVLRQAKTTIGCEVRFDIRLEDGTPLVGFVDRLDRMPNGGMDIIDYKTQKEIFDEAKMGSDWQARVYNVAVRRLYPDATDVRVSFWVLRHRVQRVTMTAVDAERDGKELVRVASEIRACENPVGRVSALCQWCPFNPDCEESKKGIQKRFKEKHG